MACFTGKDGRRFKRSTKTTNRKEAMKIAAAFEESALRLRTSRQVWQVISSLHRDITGDELVFPSVREYVKTWLARKGPETSAATLAFYNKSTSLFMAWLGEIADKPIDSITSAHLTGFRNSRSAAVAAKTANHDLKAVKMLFKAARKDGYLIENPAESVDTLRQKSGASVDRRPFTMAELRAVMDVADDEWRSMILFGFYTGARLSDVASLTWNNLDTVRGELRYQVRKTSKVMILPLAGPLADHVASLPVPKSRSGPVHSRAYAVLERTGKSGGLSNQFASLLAAARLREQVTHQGTGNGSAKT